MLRMTQDSKSPINVQYVVGRGCVTVNPIDGLVGWSVHDDNVMFWTQCLHGVRCLEAWFVTIQCRCCCNSS